MKALSVRAPWWWFILHAGKDIENRNWPTRFRGTVYLHASRTMPRTEVADDFAAASRIAWGGGLGPVPPSFDELKASAGKIVGKVDVVDCASSSASPWFFGKFGFVLRNPVAFARPVPCLGHLSLFDLPDDVVQQLGDTRAEGNLSLFGGAE